MPVRDYIRGKAAENDASNPQKGDQALSRNARLLAAEMARVPVPATRLESSVPPRFTQQPRPNVGVESGRGAHGQEGEPDAFDTDLEGIDDSTLNGSLVQDDAAPATVPAASAPPHPPPAGAGRLNSQAGHYPQFTGHPPPASFADRVNQELGSDPVDEGSFHPRANADYFDEPEPSLDLAWDEEMEFDRQPRTWQQIEATLRKPPPTPRAFTRQGFRYEVPSPDQGSPAQEPASPSRDQEPAPDPAQELDPPDNPGEPPRRAAESAVGNANGAVGNGGHPQTPRPLQKFANRTRFNAHSRLPTPIARRPSIGRFVGARPQPQTQSHQSSSREPPADRYEQRPQTTNMAGGGDAFDGTDISAVVDSSDTTSTPPVSSHHTYSPLASPSRSSSPSPFLPPGSPTQSHSASGSASALSNSGVSKRRLSAFQSDYPPNILHQKTFSDLQSESFDYDPSPPRPIFPPSDPPLPLDAQLTRLPTLTEDQRRSFFAGLPAAAWEDAGDWILDRLGEMLQRTKEARTARRREVARFEAEIARRFRETERESGEVSRLLDEMRVGGLGVLRGRTPGPGGGDGNRR